MIPAALQRLRPLVLIVDDELFMRRVLRDALEPGGYLVIEAENGKEALERVREHRPDIVLLDVVMPGMDGISVCAALRRMSEGEHLPVLMVTVAGDTDTIDRAYAAGATDFISKPINWSHLRHHIRYMLRSSRLFHELRRKEAGLAYAQRIAGLGNWEWDPTRKRLVCSEEALRILDLPYDESGIALERFIGLVHPEDRASLRQAFSGLFEAHRSFDLEHRIRLATGTQRVIHAQAEAIPDGLAAVRMAGTIQDISARKQVEERLQLSARVFDNSGEAIMITDPEGIIVDANPAFSRVTGYERSEAIARHAWEMPFAMQGPRFYRELTERLARHGQWQGEVLGRRKNGETFPALVTINAVDDSSGGICHYVAIAADISLLKETENRLQYLANFDPLTDLPNRPRFVDRLRQALSEQGGRPGGVAVLLFDLDDFKEINETLGHTAGDLVLQEVARRIQGRLGQGGVAARLGSDEFSALLSSLPDSDHAAQVAQELLALIARPFHLNGSELFLSASAGISLSRYDGKDAAELIKNAQTAMHHAKQQGKSRFTFYSERMNLQVQERLAMKNSLRKGLTREEFLLHYQPKFDSVSGRLTGLEALARWQHPGRGLVWPVHFIPLAEETGLIVPLGENMLQLACAQNRAWQSRGFPPIRVAVNLSAQQFQEKDLVATVSRVLEQTGLDPNWLELEITESVIMRDTGRAVGMLEQFKKMGIRITLDDFGTGYSSLSYLKRLPVDCLKIDYSFVRGIFADAEDAAIVRAIIAMAHTLNLKVVAEGVETEEQRQFLREQGCDEVQGYLAAMPLPVQDVERFLV